MKSYDDGQNHPKNTVNFMAMKTLWKSQWNMKFSWVVTEGAMKQGQPWKCNDIHLHRIWKLHEYSMEFFFINFSYPMGNSLKFQWLPMKISCFIGILIKCLIDEAGGVAGVTPEGMGYHIL